MCARVSVRVRERGDNGRLWRERLPASSGLENAVTTAFCTFDNRVKPPLYLSKVDFRQHRRESKTGEIKAVFLASPNFSAIFLECERKSHGKFCYEFLTPF